MLKSSLLNVMAQLRSTVNKDLGARWGCRHRPQLTVTERSMKLRGSSIVRLTDHATDATVAIYEKMAETSRWLALRLDPRLIILEINVFWLFGFAGAKNLKS